MRHPRVATRIRRSRLPQGLFDRTIDRALHRVTIRPPYPVRREVADWVREVPVVDLVVGTLLFRRGFGRRLRHGHVDVGRLREAGVDVVGLTIATRFPNRRGTLSGLHFRSLGMPVATTRSDMAMVDWFIRRARRWAIESNGRLRMARAGDEIVARPTGTVLAYVGVQGGHVIEGDLRNLERLRTLGVRTFGLAHLMDSDLAGSGTGRRAGGLTGLGREAIAECERLGILVDVAHMSEPAIRDALRVVQRPFLHSHTGFTSLAGGRSRSRRYSPGTRNLPDDVLRDVATAGGLVGVMLASRLIGGSTIDAVVRAFDLALELCGPENVAIGSDFDGAIAMPVDVTGIPWIAQALLDSGVERSVVARVLGENALRWLNSAAGVGAPGRAMA